jgi:hypothetical protein
VKQLKEQPFNSANIVGLYLAALYTIPHAFLCAFFLTISLSLSNSLAPFLSFPLPLLFFHLTDRQMRHIEKTAGRVEIDGRQLICHLMDLHP